MRNPISIRKKRQYGGHGWRKRAASSISVEQLYARTPFSSSALEQLRQARVLVFGLGSGGGKLALNLAQAGVGFFRLIDPAVLSVHNCGRHIANLRAVGQYKVDAVSDAMLLHNPTVEVEGLPWNVFDPHTPITAEQVMRRVDLVIAATDRRSVQLAINAAAWRMKIPAVFGGCYESARGGEVLFTFPREGTPCLSCLRGALNLPEPQGPFDYSSALEHEDYQGEPGLNAAVDLITDIETHVALGMLLRATDSTLAGLIDPRRNYLLIGGALAAGYYRFQRSFQIFWQPLSGPRSDCDVCQTGRLTERPVIDVPEMMPPDFGLDLQS